MPVNSINIYTLKQIKEKTISCDLTDFHISSPADCAQIIESIFDLSKESVEKFGVINVNSKNKIVGLHIISMGSLDYAVIEPRDVYKTALVNNAYAVIAFHNHPSGDPTPSAMDILLTKRLKKAGELLLIRRLDHLIIGEERFVSMKETGVI